MEASTLTTAGRAGLLARRSPVMRLQGDERLIAMIRSGNDRAFEVLFDRYHTRLLAFCRGMLRSSEDAEDVLQEVFANAHSAILADNRKIVARPWLYRIARNRCLNHLRKPVAENQETMDVLPADGGATVAEQVADREDFRDLVSDVRDLPETQRSALLLREMEALSYEEIASTMETTVPAVKSLLVRARMSLAEAGESRRLTCGDVRLELAEAAEGLAKTTGAARRHIKRCERCSTFRKQLRADGRGLTAISPLAPLAPLALIKALGGKLGLGSGSGGVAGSGAAASSGAAAASAGGVAATAAASSFGSAVAAKAMATMATAALLTAGAVGVKNKVASDPQPAPEPIAQTDVPGPAADAVASHGVHGSGSAGEAHHVNVADTVAEAARGEESAPAADDGESTEPPAPAEPAEPAEPTEPAEPDAPIIDGVDPPLIPEDPELSDEGGDSGYSGGDSDTLPGTGGSGSTGEEPEEPAEPVVPVEPLEPVQPEEPASEADSGSASDAG